MNKILIYPNINEDGIGTYVRELQKLNECTTMDSSLNPFSLKFLFSQLPKNEKLIHFPHALVPIFKGSKKIVTTIFDVTPLVIKGQLGFLGRIYFYLRVWLSVRNSDVIITSSQSTKNDLIRIFNCKDKIKVIELGPKEIVDLHELQNRQSPFNFPYFIYVGRRKKHKNIPNILRAISLLKNHPKAKLVLCGKKAAEDLELILLAETLGIADRLYFAGFVSDEDLQHYYYHAIALVFPSLYEGFGLPVLEAMANYCPVITSNAASLPEVAGDAALYVEPNDPQSIAEQMLLLLENPSMRQELIEKGLLNTKRFSWDKMRAETQKVYSQMLVN